MDEDGLLVFSVSWSEFFVFMSLVSHKYVKEKDSVSMKPARFYKQICYGRMGWHKYIMINQTSKREIF